MQSTINLIDIWIIAWDLTGMKLIGEFFLIFFTCHGETIAEYYLVAIKQCNEQ